MRIIDYISINDSLCALAYIGDRGDKKVHVLYIMRTW